MMGTPVYVERLMMGTPVYVERLMMGTPVYVKGERFEPCRGRDVLEKNFFLIQTFAKTR